MAVTGEALRVRVGASTAKITALTEVVEEAKALVDAFIDVTDEGADATELGIPQVTLDQAYMKAAVAIWNQRRAPNGVLNQQVATDEGGESVPIRISDDPLRAVRPLLSRWIGGLTV